MRCIIQMTQDDKSGLLYPLLGLVRHRIGTDGDGVTTLVAGAGCPLQCRWCINNNLLKKAPAEMVTADALFDMVKIDDLYFRATGGGVTFGGGEPLLHVGFLSRFRSICSPEWKIRVETSLAVPSGSVETAASAADEFIVDCKDPDPVRYHSYTGGDAALMLDNLCLLRDLIGPERIIVRIPLIPGYNTVSDREANAGLLREMGFSRLELFDYVTDRN